MGRRYCRISAHTAGENFEQVTDHVTTLYAYGLTPVLFKPTLAAEVQFVLHLMKPFLTSSQQIMLALKIKALPLKVGLQSVLKNVDILTAGSVGMAMGNYFFTSRR